jgi:hypothetical protein
MNDTELVTTVSTPDRKMGQEEGQETNSHTSAHRAAQLMDTDVPSSARRDPVESSPRDVEATPMRRLEPLPPKITVAHGADEVLSRGAVWEKAPLTQLPVGQTNGAAGSSSTETAGAHNDEASLQAGAMGGGDSNGSGGGAIRASAGNGTEQEGAPGNRYRRALEARRRRKEEERLSEMEALDAAAAGEPLPSHAIGATRTAEGGGEEVEAHKLAHDLHAHLLGFDPAKFEAVSLGCLSLRNPIRRLCIRCITWPEGSLTPWWDQGVLLLIMINTIQLMMFDPFDNKANLDPSQLTTGKFWPPLGRDALNAVGLVLSGLFVVECVVKVIGMGFVRGSKTYLQQRQNWLDFFVVVIGLLDFAGDEVPPPSPLPSALHPTP